MRAAKNASGPLAIKEDPMDDVIERRWSESSVGTGIQAHCTSDGDVMIDPLGPGKLESGISVHSLMHSEIEDFTLSDKP
jgi:hypothetical protein